VNFIVTDSENCLKQWRKEQQKGNQTMERYDRLQQDHIFNFWINVIFAQTALSISEDYVTRFDTILAHDGWTDRWTC